jgi:co-chaperonin GroES (HSP10)
MGGQHLFRDEPHDVGDAGGRRAQVTQSGLLLAGGGRDAMQDAQLGEVLAVGAEVDVGVARGDRVVFSKYSASDVKLPSGGEVCFVAQKSILATLS